MTSPSRDELLGYLLKALAPAEHERVEAELEQNPELAAEMARLAACLNQVGMGDVPDRYDPPVGLAERTCEFVAMQGAVAQGAVTLARQSALSVQPMERGRRFLWSDLVTMAAVFVAALSLFFPALSFSRFQSQIASCQNQLRLIGFGLHGYSELQPDRSFPGPEAEGPRAAAGVVAPMLVSHKLADPRSFLCPSSAKRRNEEFFVPTLEVLDRAALDRAGLQDLLAMQRTMGGDFGYNMGFVEEGRLEPPRDARRSGYVLVGDAPSNSLPRRVSSNHQGRGQNVLYEDGRVHFLPELPSARIFDDPYHNRDGWVAAGVDLNDAVLGASADHPLPVRVSGAER